MPRVRPPPERAAFHGPLGLVTPGVLIDENLSPALASRLAPGCVHATALGPRLSDGRLWRYARDHGLVILTKDADFFDRLSLEGAPPKVVWVRVGNVRRSDLEARLVMQWPAIAAMLSTADLVEIHPDRLEAVSFGHVENKDEKR